MKIIIGIQGWVWVGQVAGPVKGMLQLENARNIRRWGTQNGLGELHNGPLEATILDPIGSAEIPITSVVAMIKVDEERWLAAFAAKRLKEKR